MLWNHANIYVGLHAFYSFDNVKHTDHKQDTKYSWVFPHSVFIPFVKFWIYALVISPKSDQQLILLIDRHSIALEKPVFLYEHRF